MTADGALELGPYHSPRFSTVDQENHILTHTCDPCFP